jgi:heme-degrading monooxygenase HmoA
MPGKRPGAGMVSGFSRRPKDAPFSLKPRQPFAYDTIRDSGGAFIASRNETPSIPERRMQMAVKVLIKRKVPREKEKDLLKLITQLRVLASKETGYISGETMRNVKKSLEYLVISTWQNLESWKSWLANRERQKIQKEIDKLLGKKTTYEVYHYPEKRPVTLTGYRRWEGG